MVSVEWAIMRAPTRAYATLVADPRPVPALTAVGRVAVAALVVGAAMATSATGASDPVVVARTTAAWSFAIAVQAAAALALVWLSPRRRVGAARAVDLLFAANGPWTLWLAGFTLWLGLSNPFGRNIHHALVSLLAPGIWTVYLVAAYCQVVLGQPPRQAIRSTVLHQSAIWVVGLGYFFWAVQGWPRLLAWWPH